MSITRLTSLTGLLAIAALSSAQSVSFHSGNGDQNTERDAQVFTRTGSVDGSFPTLAPSDFTPTLSGENAYIFGTNPTYGHLAGGWLPNGGLSSGSEAKWIGVEQGSVYGSGSHSALYAISFNLPYTATSKLDFRFTADDRIGDANNEGLFLDGHALANTRSLFTDWNGVVENFNNIDLGVLSAGNHTLYVNVLNDGNGASGIMFEGKVSQAVPEPGTWAALGLGGLAMLRRRKK